MSIYVDEHSHENEGFKILVKYQSWRTAVLNCSDKAKPETLSYVEKHMLTDEVFVLLKGKAYLIIGEDGRNLKSVKPDSYDVIKLDLYKTYNVKAGVWHAVVMSDDASIYIVENIDTGRENGMYYDLTETEKKSIRTQVSV